MSRVTLTTLVVIAYTFSFELMVKKMKVNNFYTPAPRRERGVYCFTSVLPSVQDIFVVAFFSVTVDGRNLIFGHKRHIGIPYCG